MSGHIETLRKVIVAWRRKDVPEVLSHFSDDIVWHYAAPALPPVRGKAAASKLLTVLCGAVQDSDWRIFHYAESETHLFVEGGDVYRTPEGVQVALPYAGVLEFRDNLIVSWRDYVDLDVLKSQKAGNPWSKEVTELMERATR